MMSVSRLYSSIPATANVGKRSNFFRLSPLSLNNSKGRCRRSRASFWYSVLRVLKLSDRRRKRPVGCNNR
jgi:hypothetical protein